jgi:hypothetical protein
MESSLQRAGPAGQEVLRKLHEKMGGQSSIYQQFMQEAGEYGKLAEAQRNVQEHGENEHKLDVKIGIEEHAIAKQIEDQVVPKLRQIARDMLHQITEGMRASIDRLEQERRDQQQHAGG